MRKNHSSKFFSIGFSFIRKGFYYLIEAMDLLKNENIKLDLRTNIPDFFRYKTTTFKYKYN